MSRDPVSWIVVQPGWTVHAADGEEIGSVEEVLGDPESDIFNGLNLSSGFLGSTTRYVPAEIVESVFEGRIELSVSETELDRLQADANPPGPD
jgi:uncharacterized protein YrrD